ncbi:hypothetical protein TorRG33x02_041070 [Trema orientale]|uniref:Uncharacterized protein n=1 Tax=Trema orientale TaxID=63057 RepID=A0A2P5FQ95_TREOI|nr:hypothetical protein TorRG33x02_041070 [Trema orientale]
MLEFIYHPLIQRFRFLFLAKCNGPNSRSTSVAHFHPLNGPLSFNLGPRSQTSRPITAEVGTLMVLQRSENLSEKNGDPTLTSIPPAQI